MDRLTSMAIFARVVEAEGFSAAVERLGLSRGAVSKHILQLEDHLGVRLLNRTTRRVSLTEIGRTYYERCIRVLGEVEEADQIVARLYAEPRGTLRVNGPMSFGILHLGNAIADFLYAHPRLGVDLALDDRFVDVVEEGYDVAIRIARLADSSLIARRLAPARCVLVAAPRYLAAHGTPHHPGELARHRCLAYTYLASGNEWRLTGAGGAETVRISGPFAANNGDVIKAAALEGAGIALLPTFMVGPALRDGSLMRVLPGHELPTLSIFAVYPANRHVSAKVRVFIDFLVERFGPEPYWDAGL
ncbi:MAG: LysR family transcriptional regulator [Alphaproteobacteria bacterium]|nr:LysR family transcriptional regulator [Alphaproteobacteria bacterium]